ncbi:class I SAM-dependent methyltransferase [Serinicoccus sp. LYQ131]|uniref:class I SAM-dependent methyltransferase n=1 Tax=Serinicoccus sp. LYQ131 TaxID=3378797 RepID=UPI00385437A4
MDASDGPAAPDMPTLARSFQGIGADYERHRPGFPAAVLDLLVPQPFESVLDLGAGTGKLTELLVTRTRRVTAVEPSAAMLAVLTAKLPEVQAYLASAEALPVEADSQDLVTVAQAFHWFDREAACAEIVRVLRPGGRLGLLWNTPDPVCAWDVAAHQAAHPGMPLVERSDPPRQEELPGLQAVDATAVRWEEHLTRHEYLQRWSTVSTFLSAPRPLRAQMMAQVEDILDRDPDTAGREDLLLPHRTEVFLHRRPR